MKRNIVIAVPPYAGKLLHVLDKHGVEAYIVGGWVRDKILGRPSHDVDMCSSALWQDACNICQEAGFRVIETGTKHGTITVVVDGHLIELTTFRKESSYSDNRHPDSVEFVDSLDLDLARRDFTCNALAFHPKKGVVDLFGGIEDLDARLIRSVGEAKLRFSEDALRILRALRFSLRLDFTIEQTSARALHCESWRLDTIAKERIGEELQAILAYDLSEAFMTYFDVFEHALGVTLSTDQLAKLKDLLGLHFSITQKWASILAVLYPTDYQQSLQLLHRFALNRDVVAEAVVFYKVLGEKIPATMCDVMHLLQSVASGNKNAFRLAQDALELRAKFYGDKAYRQALSMIDTFGEKNLPYEVGMLKVNGSNLVELGLKPGRQIKLALESLLEAVVMQEVSSDREAQLDWLQSYVSGV